MEAVPKSKKEFRPEALFDMVEEEMRHTIREFDEKTTTYEKLQALREMWNYIKEREVEVHDATINKSGLKDLSLVPGVLQIAELIYTLAGKHDELDEDEILDEELRSEIYEWYSDVQKKYRPDIEPLKDLPADLLEKTLKDYDR